MTSTWHSTTKGQVMILRGLRDRFGAPPPEVVFRFRLLALEATLIVLLTLASIFDVIPVYIIIALTFAVGLWFSFFSTRYDRTLLTITNDGWEKFLDGREELGEYEELGGKYEYIDDEDNDR